MNEYKKHHRREPGEELRSKSCRMKKNRTYDKMEAKPIHSSPRMMKEYGGQPAANWILVFNQITATVKREPAPQLAI